MDTYITDQRNEGQLDSEGAFTVDSLAALRITLASALPEPHFYHFLIAQSLYAAGATEIEVAIGRQATRFSFHDQHGLFSDLQAGLERLGKGLSLASPKPLDLLLMGMATAVGSEMDRADLFGPDSDRDLQISLQQAQIVEAPAGRSSRRTTVALHRSVNKGVSFAWSRVWGARRDEGELLRRFRYASPPLKIAGLATSPTPVWFEGAWSAETAGPTVLLEAAVLDEASGTPGHRAFSSHPMMPAEGDVGEEISAELSATLGPTRLDGQANPSGRCLFRRAYSVDGEPIVGDLEAPLWQNRKWTFYFTSNPDAEATILWIRNGMYLETWHIDLGLPGLFVIAPSEGLDVDASGFSLVVNLKADQRVTEARALAAKLASSLDRDQVKDLYHRGRASSPLHADDEASALLAAFPWL